MEARNTWTKTTASLDCGTVTLVMTTKRPAHHYLAITQKRPGQTPSMSFPDDNQPTHRRNYRFITETIIEQTEPGETTTHTFTFPWPPRGLIFWAIASDALDPRRLTSKSPVYAYMLDIKASVFVEPWKTVSLTRSLPQGWTATGGGNYEVGPGVLHLFATDSGISIRHAFSLPVDTPEACTTFLQIEGTTYDGDKALLFQQAWIHFVFGGGFNLGGYDRAIYVHANSCDANSLTLPATDIQLKRIVGNRLYNLSALARDEVARCGSPSTPYNGKPLTEISFNLNAISTPGHRNASLQVGPLAIYTVSTTLHDVSSLWRRMNLWPSPRPVEDAYQWIEPAKPLRPQDLLPAPFDKPGPLQDLLNQIWRVF